MSRPASIRQPVFFSLTLTCIAAAWWGCARSTEQPTTATSSSSSTGQGGSSGNGGAGGVGGINVDLDGGPLDDATCTSTSVAAKRVQLDIIFLIDQSAGGQGAEWIGITTGLKAFFTDPASANIGAGLVYFPNHKPDTCVPEDYQVLDVPIHTLPANVFALTNSMPANATGINTPLYGALKGSLMAATAYQDAHPTHKVVLVVATEGHPTACSEKSVAAIADLAKGARAYNGVLTYVIATSQAVIADIDAIAAAGGTTSSYDITKDINQFTAKMEEIRGAALGCEFDIPPPPNNQQIDPDKVNFSYTPKGVGTSKLLLRADDLADCNGKPGWYYDDNVAPTKMTLCPASCNTVKADSKAKIDGLFGCKSQIN